MHMTSQAAAGYWTKLRGGLFPGQVHWDPLAQSLYAIVS